MCVDRIARREQERQRRKNIQQLQAKDLLETGGTSWVPKAALPKDWDTRWIKLPSADVILSSSPELDGTRWDSDWPGSFVRERQASEGARERESARARERDGLVMGSVRWLKWNRATLGECRERKREARGGGL